MNGFTDILTLAGPALLAAVVSFCFTPLAERLARAVGAVDQPEERKVHLTPIPRLGGLSVLCGVLAAFMLVEFAGQFLHRELDRALVIGMAAGLIPVLLISLIDDIRPLRSGPKLVMHLIGASIAVASGIRLLPEIHVFGHSITIGWLAIPISVLWIAGITNAFNIVDGLDGLSAGLALISAVSLGSVSLVIDRLPMGVAAFAIAGAILGFLPYNMHPARIFLGDTGAASIGFILGCLALRGGSSLNAGMAILLPIVVLGVPIAETLVSMLRRVLRRADGIAGGVFEADRAHFHHRLLDLGLDHRKAVFTLYGVGVLLALAGFLSVLVTYTYAAFMMMSLLVAAFIGIGRLGYDEFALVRRGTLLRIYDLPGVRNAPFVVLSDLVIVISAIWLTIALKWDDWGVDTHRALAESMLIVMPGLTVASLAVFGVYRRSWRVAGIDCVIRSSFATLSSSVIGWIIISNVFVPGVAHSFFILYVIILTMILNASRVSYRVFAEWHQRTAASGEPTLIYGAGAGGVAALREILANPARGLQPVGFLDDDPAKSGKTIHGFPIWRASHAEMLLEQSLARSIVVSSAKIPDEKVKTLRDICDAHETTLRYFVQYLGERDDNRASDPEIDLPSVPDPDHAQQASPAESANSVVIGGVATRLPG